MRPSAINTERLLCDLIALPSVNPAFLPVNHPRGGEQRVAEFLAATTARAGLDVSFQRAGAGRSNLLARLCPGRKARQRILLAPHLDTVNASDEQFTPRKKGGRLFGRGSCDTKGSVAAMIGALCDLASDSDRPKETEILFAGLADEENHQAGSRALARRVKADLAIVGEPTGLRIVTAHKGNLWLEFETRGKAAHGARPDLGKNAVHEMARVVCVLEGEYAARLRKRRHRLLGCATVSVGAICGGTQANIVPDYCRILVDRRTLPGETEASVRSEIFALLRRKGIRATISDGKISEPFPGQTGGARRQKGSAEALQAGSCLPMETPANDPWVARFLHEIGQTKLVGVDYFCDASVLSQGGIPSVVFGPGDISQAHTANEWISIKSLERARAMLLRFLKSLP